MLSLRTHHPYSGTEEMMATKLERIAEISAQTAKPVFTSLYHMIDADLLKKCFEELDGKKAVGIDEVTKEEYGRQLDSNIADLVKRLKNKSYKPMPTKRVFIPKGNGKLRPLGIASFEDKIVQLALKKVLEAVYEPRFLNCMYGFRPKRGCHEAVKDVYQHTSRGKINFIVDADVKGFFDHIDHEWMMKFLEWHIKDPNILWLVRKYLKAGVMVDGMFEETEEGTIQGGNISPTLANIYMYNVLALWFMIVVRKEVKGDCFLVNYADDFVAGFQYKSDAEKYYIALKERMAKFNLELEESKSRLIEFGRYAEQNRKAKGLGKPETFDFLGFTFFMGKSRRGYPCPMVKTSRKKFEKSLKNFKRWLYENKEQPAGMLVKQLNVKLVGYYRYYGVTFNSYKLKAFLHRVQQFLHKAMNRRGCRRTYAWNGFIDMLKVYPLAQPKIYYALY